MSFKKSRVNIILDAILYLTLLAIAFTGLLIKYILITGTEENHLYGKEVDLYLLDLNRHQWGDIHFILSLLFISLCLLHICLHTKYIIGFINKVMKSAIAFQITIGIIAIITSLVLSGILLIKPEIRTHNFLHIRQNQFEHIQPNSTNIEYVHDKEIEIWGSMSLIEATNKYNISIQLIQKEFGISQDDCVETVGRLRKKHGFTITQLKEVFIESRKNDL